jgi:hypothetical protein
MYNLNTMQRAVVLGAASLALTASPALAQPDYPATHVTQSAPGQAASSIDLRSPDAQDAQDAIGGPSLDLRSPDATDAGTSPARVTSSLAGTTSASPRVAAAVEPAKADDDLDWGSVAIGGGAILAVSLIGLGGMAVTHRTRVGATR